MALNSLNHQNYGGTIAKITHLLRKTSIILLFLTLFLITWNIFKTLFPMRINPHNRTKYIHVHWYLDHHWGIIHAQANVFLYHWGIIHTNTNSFTSYIHVNIMKHKNCTVKKWVHEYIIYCVFNYVGNNPRIIIWYTVDWLNTKGLSKNTIKQCDNHDQF